MVSPSDVGIHTNNTDEKPCTCTLATNGLSFHDPIDGQRREVERW